VCVSVAQESGFCAGDAELESAVCTKPSHDLGKNLAAGAAVPESRQTEFGM